MRALLVALGLALVLAGSAVADHLDPQERIRAADQARAKAMLLRESDLAGFQRQPASGADPHLTCAALDESDLTVTGDAEAPSWALSVVFVTSSSTVYASRADASTSWRRGTSAAGMRCLRVELGGEFARQGARVVSLRRVPFPAVAQRSAAYRLTLAGTSQGQTFNAFVDFVVLGQDRALAALVMGSALVPPDRQAEIRLARTIAGRMAKAMRGAS
jgi:hypothetical protein